MLFGLGLIRDINPFEIIRHPWFISAFFAGGLAQLIKFTFVAIRWRRFDFSLLWSAGGMPSAHAALVTALAVSVGLTEGFDSHEAMIAVGVGTIVLADAATLRPAVGDQAAILNCIVDRMGGPEKFGSSDCANVWAIRTARLLAVCASAWRWPTSSAGSGISGSSR